MGFAGIAELGQTRRSVPSPQNVIESGRLNPILAEADEALSAMVLAVHDDMNQAIGDGRARSENRHIEPSLQVVFCQHVYEGPFVSLSLAEELDHAIERIGKLRFLCHIEGSHEDAGQEESLRHDDMVQSFEDLLVVDRPRMTLHSLQEGSVGPRLVTKEGTKQIDHNAMIMLGPCCLGRRFPGIKRDEFYPDSFAFGQDD